MEWELRSGDCTRCGDAEVRSLRSVARVWGGALTRRVPSELTLQARRGVTRRTSQGGGAVARGL